MKDWWDPEDPDFPGVKPIAPGPGDPDDPDEGDDDEPDKEFPGKTYKADWEVWDQGNISEDREAEEIKKIFDELEADNLLGFLKDEDGGGGGGDGGGENAYEKVPDCFYMQLKQYSDVDEKRTAIAPYVIFGGAARCSSGVWCSSTSSNDNGTYCDGADLVCNNDMKMKVSQTQYGWLKVDFSDPKFRDGEKVSFKAPWVLSNGRFGKRDDCPVTLFFDKGEECWEWTYGGYILDGTCQDRAVSNEAELELVPKIERGAVVIS